MYCPWCGARNDVGKRNCFVCSKVIPALEEERPLPSKSPTRRTVEKREVYGSVGDRGLALLADRMLLLALLAPVAAAIASSWTPPDGQELAPLNTSIASGAIAILVVFLYHTILEATTGTTLGKAIMGLHVRSEGERPKIVASAIRNLLRVVDGLLLYAVGFLVALFSARRQRLGDRVAETTVLAQDPPPMLRAVLLVIWIVLVVASLWIGRELCPDCWDRLRGV
ncbi:MAG: RDD family protein [Thermoanaerobaculia bacterium]